MSKELPYFKFEPSEWDNGNIQMCSRESKGLFIDLCSIYWTRLGELPYALALQKLCNGSKDALQELIKHEIIGVVNDQIVIDFLDEQLLERGEVSVKRRESALKRWSDASALQLESKSNASREEEKRVEESKKEKKKEEIPLRAFVDDEIEIVWKEWVQYMKERKKKLTPSTVKKQIKFLGGRAGPEVIEIINRSITNGWIGLFELKEKTNGISTKINTRSAEQIEPNRKYAGKL